MKSRRKLLEQQERYLTPPEIAARLRVCPHKVLAWFRKGEMGAINVGEGTLRPRYRISPEDFQAFLRGRQVQPPPPIIRRRRKSPDIIEFF
jgi:excisionase family DNA binding protein